jgi:UDP-N-acetylglucosamine kinase
MNDKQLIVDAIAYLNETKKVFLQKYTDNIESSPNREAFLTAGMSGVGKTEFAKFLKENDKNLLHIDTDAIREYFTAVGYNGQNSDIFQEPASKGFSKLFDYALKKGYSIILDSNLSNIEKATQNIDRLLNKNYAVNIFYLYNEPEKCYKFTRTREVLTKRKVPYDVFVKSNLDSYKTVTKLKNQFQDDIILNYIDKKNDILHNNITLERLNQEVGVYFDN